MDFAVEHLGQVVRLAPRGRIDSTTAELFKERMATLIQTGCRDLVIDFTHVPYMTSAGFRCLLLAETQLQESSGRMALCGMGHELQRLFDISAFTDHFTILPTLDECVARLSKPNV